VLIDSDYEWGQHVLMSAGILDDADRHRIVDGPAAPGWNALEATILAAVDELHARGGISDATWSSLAEELEREQLIELPMLVGHYHMLGFVLHALGVPRDEGCPPLP
jgi:4-carboxymuconolactone decarboxylase